MTTRTDIKIRYARLARQISGPANHTPLSPYDAGRTFAAAIWMNLTEPQKTIISFGMTPKELHDRAEKWFIETTTHGGGNVTPAALADFARGFTVGLFDQRTKEGKMIA